MPCRKEANSFDRQSGHFIQHLLRSLMLMLTLLCLLCLLRRCCTDIWLGRFARTRRTWWWCRSRSSKS